MGSSWGVGAHNWYLGEKKNGIIHVALIGAGFVLLIIASAILPSVMSFYTLLTMSGLVSTLGALGYLCIAASGIWGFVEGIIILSKGDAGLAARGYRVATPVNPQMYNNQGYGPMPQQGPYAQQGPYGPQNPYASQQGSYGSQNQAPQNFNGQFPQQNSAPTSMNQNQFNQMPSQNNTFGQDGVNNNGQ